jgi:NTE family protein
VISELTAHVPEPTRKSAAIEALAACGCRTTMHILQLSAPSSKSEGFAADIDFTSDGIRSRWESGYADARDAIAQSPWMNEGDPLDGVFVHEFGWRAVADAETQ